MKTLAKIVTFVGVSLATQLSHATVINEIEPNDTIGTAQNIDGTLSVFFDANVESGPASNDSATVPHVTINGTGDDTFDIFSFTIATPNTMGIFDIDNALPDEFAFDSHLRLYDTDANLNALLAANDDSTFDGPGDEMFTFNSFLEFTFAAAGLYYIEVGACCVAEVPPSAAGYQLHVSLAEPAVGPGPGPGPGPGQGVPLPGTLALFAAGILGAGLSRRRRA